MIQNLYLVREGADIASSLRRALENGAPVSPLHAKKNLSANTVTDEVVVVSLGKDWTKALQVVKDLRKDGLQFYAVFSSPTMLQETLAQLETPSKRVNGKEKLGARRSGAHQIEEPCLDELIEKKLSHFVSKICQSEGKNLYELLIQEVEKPLIKFALKETEGNQVQASQLLGMHRNTLRKKMKDLKIVSGKTPSPSFIRK